MNNAPLAQWLEKLEHIHPTEVELGLDRVSAVAGVLKLLPVEQPVVTVAGTNGKGSTVAVLEALLTEAGYTTGTYTSPHMLRFNERIRVAGVDVSDEELVDAFSAIEEARGAITLTYFEFATLAALFIFRSRGPEFIVLEVGLGGRLDAVNLVDPTVAVITSIALDHQEWLGNSRGEIAREKAGILRSAKPVVIADPVPPEELMRCVEDVGADPALYLGREFSLKNTQEGWRGQLQQPDGESRLLAPQMKGALLPENICAAAQAALLLGVDFSDDCLSRALASAAPVGRRQLRHFDGREYILDVAHNPAAVLKLLEHLNVTPCKGRTLCIFSMMSDKRIQDVVDVLRGYFDGWFLADQPHNTRAARAADIATMLGIAGESRVSMSKNLRQALRRAQSVSSKGDRLVVFGSFYTVAGVLPLLEKDNDRHEAH